MKKLAVGIIIILAAFAIGFLFWYENWLGEIELRKSALSNATMFMALAFIPSIVSYIVWFIKGRNVDPVLKPVTPLRQPIVIAISTLATLALLLIPAFLFGFTDVMVYLIVMTVLLSGATSASLYVFKPY